MYLYSLSFRRLSNKAWMLEPLIWGNFSHFFFQTKRTLHLMTEPYPFIDFGNVSYKLYLRKSQFRFKPFEGKLPHARPKIIFFTFLLHKQINPWCHCCWDPCYFYFLLTEYSKLTNVIEQT